MEYIVDRIEGDIAVCEKDDRSMVDIPLSKLPKNIHEGACLVEEDGVYTLDTDKEAARKARIEKKMNSLFKD